MFIEKLIIEKYLEKLQKEGILFTSEQKKQLIEANSTSDWLIFHASSLKPYIEWTRSGTGINSMFSTTKRVVKIRLRLSMAV